MHLPTRLHVGRMRALVAAPGLLAAMALALPVLQAQETSQPAPQVEAHKSKWDYPKELKLPEGSRTHTVEKGDTLWDLSGKYLGNPYAWPQIWELNQWVKDPHWIYPGDPLVIDLARGVANAGSLPDAIADLPPDQVRRADPNSVRRPELGFTFQDFIQMPFMAPTGAESYFKTNCAFTITANKRDDRQYLAEGEMVYVNGGVDQGIKAGDRYLVLKPVKRMLVHPTNPKQKMGDVLQQTGVVRVITAQAKSSVAIIERCLETVEVGDHLVKFTEPANIPMTLRTDITEPIQVAPTAGVVIYARDSKVHAANGDMIIIDRGANDGLKVGDVLLSTRVRSFTIGADGAKKPAKDTFAHYIGQVLVIRTDARTATCRILRSSEEIVTGDTITR